MNGSANPVGRNGWVPNRMNPLQIDRTASLTCHPMSDELLPWQVNIHGRKTTFILEKLYPAFRSRGAPELRRRNRHQRDPRLSRNLQVELSTVHPYYYFWAERLGISAVVGLKTIELRMPRAQFCTRPRKIGLPPAPPFTGDIGVRRDRLRFRLQHRWDALDQDGPQFRRVRPPIAHCPRRATEQCECQDCSIQQRPRTRFESIEAVERRRII